jgi:hypothetical protein
MPRKASKVLSAAEQRAHVKSLRGELKDAKASLTANRKLVSSAKKELRTCESAFKKQERVVATAAKAVAKATGK